MCTAGSRTGCTRSPPSTPARAPTSSPSRCSPSRPAGCSAPGSGVGHSVLIGFAAKSDFILATAGEELGLAGLSALFLLYGLLVERGYRAGLSLRDPFGRLLAVGLASIVALQVFVIAGGVTGLIPLTGMAMPFLAQGGSSVVTNWAIVALLIRVSDSARRPYDGARLEAYDDAHDAGRHEAGRDTRREGLGAARGRAADDTTSRRPG